MALIEDGGLLPHMYADDTQVCGSCPPTAVKELSQKLSDCVNAVASWMTSNRLQLNASKTEVLWCASINCPLTCCQSLARQCFR